MVSEQQAKQLHVLFSGRVQGVGFRYTVCRIAQRYAVTGFVRNLPNGDVELLAEGEETVLSDFLHEIRNSQLREYILRDLTTWHGASGRYDRFGVTF